MFNNINDNNNFLYNSGLEKQENIIKLDVSKLTISNNIDCACSVKDEFYNQINLKSSKIKQKIKNILKIKKMKVK